MVLTSTPLLPNLLVAHLKTTKTAYKFPQTTAPYLEKTIACAVASFSLACSAQNHYNRSHIHKISDLGYIYKTITPWPIHQNIQLTNELDRRNRNFPCVMWFIYEKYYRSIIREWEIYYVPYVVRQLITDTNESILLWY